uniref:Immunoglobulin-like beta-sandwich domain-containing protein n=1 Tax=Panthera leo TaxID=9689 RepID=A0A8C8YBG7_PANLE
MVRLRPGRGKRGRPSLLSRWTTYHESFFPEFFIQRIWTQVGGPPVLCSSLSAWPSPVVPQGQCVTLQCHSHCRFGMFRLYKVTGALIPELHSIILQDSFLAGPVTPAHAGTYRCCGSYLGSSSVWSPPSDPLLIVVTGVYRKPSLSAQPGPLVKSEGNMTFFVLHSEELSKAPWHLPGQPHREGSHANFIMGPVTAAHAGTYRCFGKASLTELPPFPPRLHKKLSLWAQLGAVLCSGENMTLSCCSESNFDVYHLPRDGQLRGRDGASWAHFLLGPAKPALGGTYICHGSFNSSPCEWSGPSDPLYLSVTPDTCMLWLGPLVAIIFLTILLFFLTHRWSHATKSESWEEEASFHLSRDPPAEDPQEVTYTELGHCIFTQQKTTPTSQGPKEHSSDASVYMEFVRPIKA